MGTGTAGAYTMTRAVDVMMETRWVRIPDRAFELEDRRKMGRRTWSGRGRMGRPGG